MTATMMVGIYIYNCIENGTIKLKYNFIEVN